MSSSGSSGNSSGSAAFSRLNRPGSGRLLTTPGAAAGSQDGAGVASGSWDRRARSGSGRSSNASSSSTPASLSPTSPMGPGLVAEHRIRPLPGAKGLPGPASNEQQVKRSGLKISFSTPNIKKSAKMSSSASASSNLSALANFPGLAQIGSGNGGLAVGTGEEKSKLLLYKGAHSTGKLKFGNDLSFDFKAEDLSDEGEIGRGAFGSVNKMSFVRNDFTKTMAVKRIRSTVDEREQKELLMDLDVVMRSTDCSFIVTFFGAIFKEGDCWICMELMDTSTDKFYKFIYEQLRESIPEDVIGKITVATVKALNYLKEKLKIIHRDVKPSNILLDKRGNIKLCDFGISGQLVDSIAKTRDAGCRPYMAPERIDPQRAKGYDIRSDVWSLGITLIELATGCFPYPKWNSVFEQLQQVVHGDPPRLEPAAANRSFTPEFVEFVNTCLIKDEMKRPKYTKLLEHTFIKRSDSESTDVARYVSSVLGRWETYDNGECEPMDHS